MNKYIHVKIYTIEDLYRCVFPFRKSLLPFGNRAIKSLIV